MRGLRLFAIGIAVAFAAWPCWARGLSAPFRLGTAQVLPQGVRSVSVSGITTMVDTWHNGEGNVIGVAEPMVQQLSYKRLLSAEKDEELKANVEAQLRAKGIPLTNIAGTSLADINTRVAVTLPALAIGLSERWTLALAVPILYTHIDNATSFAGTEELQELVTDFSSKSRGQTETINNKLTDVIATELSNKNYTPLENRQRTELGDITLVSKYRLYNSLGFKWAMTNRLTLPTGRPREAHLLVDPAPGDGQWDFGVTSNIEIPLSGKFKLLQEVGYLVQLPDHHQARVPVSRDELLSADFDPRIYRDLGDIVHGVFGASYTPWSFLSLGVGYYAAYKNRDHWSGGVVDPSRYYLLGRFTNQSMQAMVVQMGLSSISAFRAKKFPLPMSMNLVYSKAFAGRNVRNNGVWSANLAMFF